MKARKSTDPERPILDSTIEISPDAVKVSALRDKVGTLSGTTARTVLKAFLNEPELMHLYVHSVREPGLCEFDRETTDQAYRAFRFSRPQAWTAEALTEMIARCDTPEDFLEVLGQGQADRFVLWTALHTGIPVITDEEPPRPFLVVSDHAIELSKTLANKGAKPKPNKAPASSFVKAPARNKPVETVTGTPLEEAAHDEIIQPNMIDPSFAQLARTGVDLETLVKLTPPVDQGASR